MGNLHLRFDEGRARRSHAAVTLSPTLPSKGFWAVTVRANWRVTFRFADGDALDVDYVDYH